MIVDHNVTVKHSNSEMWVKRRFVLDHEYIYLYRLVAKGELVCKTEIKYSKIRFIKEIKDKYSKRANILSVSDKKMESYLVQFKNSEIYLELKKRMNNPERRLRTTSSMKIIGTEEKPKRKRQISMPKIITPSKGKLAAKIFNSNNGKSNFTGINTSASFLGKELFKDKFDCFKLITSENSQYYYDCAVLEGIMQENDISLKDFPELIERADREETKKILVSVLVAQSMTEQLREACVKSILVVLQEKKSNRNFVVSSHHEHSLKQNIVCLANLYFGSTKESADFRRKTLPGILEKNFACKSAHKQVNSLNLAYICSAFQFYSGVTFTSVTNLDFSASTPFLVESIKTLNPSLVNSVFMQAFREFSARDNTKNSSRGETHLKRLDLGQIAVENFNFEIENWDKFNKQKEKVRLSTVALAREHVAEKRWSLALDLCEFYLLNWGESVFLNPQIYCLMAEIYFRQGQIDSSLLLFSKAEETLTDLLGEDNSFLVEILHNKAIFQLKMEGIAHSDVTESISKAAISAQLNFEESVYPAVLVKINQMLISPACLTESSMALEFCNKIKQLVALDRTEQALAFLSTALEIEDLAEEESFRGLIKNIV